MGDPGGVSGAHHYGSCRSLRLRQSITNLGDIRRDRPRSCHQVVRLLSIPDGLCPGQGLVLMHLTGGAVEIGRICTDGSGELMAAARDLSWRHDVSTPQGPLSNGVAEQAIRRTLAGSRALLLQSGRPHPFWCDDVQALGALRNMSDKIDGRRTRCLLRHGRDLNGFVRPFGASTECEPASHMEENRINGLASSTTRGIS